MLTKKDMLELREGKTQNKFKNYFNIRCLTNRKMKYEHQSVHEMSASVKHIRYMTSSVIFFYFSS